MSPLPKSHVRRKTHFLKSNKTVQIPQEWISLDTETLPEDIGDDKTQHNFRLGVACRVVLRPNRAPSQREIVWFREPYKFWDWLDDHCKPSRRVMLAAHNADYDFRVMDGFNELRKRGWKLERWLLDKGKFLLRYRDGKRSLMVIDTFMLYPVSLAKIGDSLGLKKKQMPEFDAPDMEWFEYCDQDVAVLTTAVERWREFLIENDLGTFKPTLASQAMAAFRHRFMDPAPLIHDNHDVSKVERNAYFGGRVECFRLGKIGKGPFYKLDVNSMYPFVMARDNFPYRIEALHPTAKDIIRAIESEDKCAVAEVDIETETPCLPKRYKKRLCFPIGRFTTTLVGKELEYAYRNDLIKFFHSGVTYHQGPIFRAYVNYFYRLRRQYIDAGNEAFSFITKLFLNSLYGKFGQKGRNWVKVGETFPGDYWVEEGFDIEDEAIYTERCIDGQVYRGYEEGESWDSFPAISAAVTASARIELWETIERAQRENTFYCDTDSLIVNRKGFQRLQPLIDDTELGCLKVEEITAHLEIWGLKSYQTDASRHRKGVPATALVWADGTYQKQVWRRILSGVRSGDPSKYVVELKDCQLRDAYTKGVVDRWGRVTPYRF